MFRRVVVASKFWNALPCGDAYQNKKMAGPCNQEICITRLGPLFNSDAETTNCVTITDLLMCCPRHRRTLYRGAVRTYRNEAQFVESVTPEVNFEIEPMKEEDKQKFEQEFDAFLRSLDPHRHVGAAPKDTSPKGTQSVVASKDATDKVFKSKEQKKPTTTKSEHESPITGTAVTADKTFEQDSVSQRQTKSNLSNASIASKPSPTTTTYNGH